MYLITITGLVILTKEDVDNFLSGEKGSNDTIDSNNNYSILPYKTENELDNTEISIGSFINLKTIASKILQD